MILIGWNTPSFVALLQIDRHGKGLLNVTRVEGDEQQSWSRGVDAQDAGVVAKIAERSDFWDWAREAKGIDAAPDGMETVCFDGPAILIEAADGERRMRSVNGCPTAPAFEAMAQALLNLSCKKPDKLDYQRPGRAAEK